MLITKGALVGTLTNMLMLITKGALVGTFYSYTVKCTVLTIYAEVLNGGIRYWYLVLLLLL
jgi:hypothetical protein